MKLSTFPGRVALQQRVLPAYRTLLFDALAAACRDGLCLFAGQPQIHENITSAQGLQVATYVPARNRQLLKVGSPYYLLWQLGLLRWLRDCDPTVLVVEANSRYLSNRLAVRWMHARGRPVLGWGLGDPSRSRPLSRQGSLTALRDWERLSFLRSLDGVIAYSQRGAQEYRAADFPAERVFVALNAVAPRPAAPPAARPPGFTGPATVLFVGRLQARKRIDLLIQACAALPRDLQPQLWIVGDGPARAELQALAVAVYPLAHFLGHRRGAELGALFTAADLFVLPGTGGLAVQQAMAYGLPVIVAEGDGTQDDLVRSSNGWRILPGDQDALVDALKSALADPERLRQMGDVSYRIVAEEINLETMVDAFIKALCTIIV